MEPDVPTEAEAGPCSAQKKKFHPLASRIKRVMQTDEDVGKIAQATPHLIALATERFLKHLAGGALQVAESRRAKTLQPAHIKAFVNSEAVLDFLKDAVASAPDIPEEDPEPVQKAKRKRQRKVKEGVVTAKGGDEDEDPPSSLKSRAKRPTRVGAGKRKGAVAVEAAAEAVVKSEDDATEKNADAERDTGACSDGDCAPQQAAAVKDEAGGDDADGDAGHDEDSQRSAPSGWHTAGVGTAQQRHEEDVPGFRTDDGGLGKVPNSPIDDQPDAADPHARSEHPAQQQQQQQQQQHPLDLNDSIGEIPPAHASPPHGSYAVDGVGEEHGGGQVEAAQAVEAGETTGGAGADLDALDVPMVWLEPQAAGFAVEEEDYD